ncbi:MAG: DUF5000 domain-containing lipoprotein [Draconibacterium sp.]
MKKQYIIYLHLFLAFVLLNNCSEESIGQYPVDDTAPQKVSNVVVENIPGGAVLDYDLPDEDDLLYVQAIYELPNGTKGVMKTSVFSNNMIIKGFGKSQKRNVNLISVDRSRNESSPLNVEIEPKDSPIYGILDSLTVQESFGGFKLSWPNYFQEDIVLGVLKKDEGTQEFEYIENFYSSESKANKAVRGLDSTRATFGIFVRDTYGNRTDTLEMSLKPFYEEQIPKDGFIGMRLSSWYKLHSYGGGMDCMWDGITNVDNNIYYIQNGNEIMPFFTFDMGVKAKLSRFKMWQRVNFLFALHNPQLFEWYGTNDAAVAADSETLDWESNPAWIKIMDGESKKPSGLPAGAALTPEDDAYGRAGEEFEFPLDIPAVRYLRFKELRTWSGSSGCCIGELTFWGQIEK